MIGTGHGFDLALFYHSTHTIDFEQRKTQCCNTASSVSYAFAFIVLPPNQSRSSGPTQTKNRIFSQRTTRTAAFTSAAARQAPPATPDYSDPSFTRHTTFDIN